MTPQNPGVSLTTCQRMEYLGITYRDTTISRPIHQYPFMPIFFRKIYEFLKTINKSSSYNSLILHIKYSFFYKKVSQSHNSAFFTPVVLDESQIKDVPT